MPRTIDALRERRGFISQDKPLNFVPQHIHQIEYGRTRKDYNRASLVTEVTCAECEYKATHYVDISSRRFYQVVVHNEGKYGSKRINWK